MPNGRLSRRTSPRLARVFAVLSLALTSAGSAGCQRYPVRHALDLPEGTTKTSLPVAPHDADVAPPGELPELPASPLASATPGGQAGPVVDPTPLLDAALARAGDARLEPPARAETEPVVLPEVKEAKEETGDGSRASSSKPTPAEAPESATAVEATKPSNPVGPVVVASLTSRDEWPSGLEKLRALASRRAGEPGAEAESWTVRARVLDWLAGEGPAPRESYKPVWTSVMTALTAATAAETPDGGDLANRLHEAVEALESLAPLEIRGLHLCRKVNGFGSFEPIDARPIRAGQPLLIYCELGGVCYEHGDALFRSRLASRVEIVPANGGTPAWSETLGTAEDVCRRRRRDYYVNYRIVLPASLAPGAYTLRLDQTDEISGRSVSAETPLTVSP